MEKIYGLIGYPLSHSFSAAYFTKKFATENIDSSRYLNFPLENISEVVGLINTQPYLKGLNVTIPHKESVIPFLDEMSDSALETGAVNTIKINHRDGQIATKGYNTDVYGFEKSLETFKVDIPNRTLILGTGGASKAVEWVMNRHESELIFATRNPIAENHISYEDIDGEMLRTFQLVVNTTPLGMHPNQEGFPPLPYEAALNSCTFFDLIYNPAETLFLRKAKIQGCKTINGLYMLEQQAEKSWEIWNNAAY